MVVADVNGAAGEALAAELGTKARFALTDVTSPESGQAAVDLAIREFGSLHGLVSCAGILGASRIVGRDGPHDLSLVSQGHRGQSRGDIQHAPAAATSAMSMNAPNAEGERGVIVNTASISAFEGQIGQAAYAASKGGVASLTLPAARELSRLGIRVVAIAPGVFETAMMAAAPDAVPRFAGRPVGLSRSLRPGRIPN